MKQNLMYERWRPSKLEEMILLPRIESIFQNGLNQNVILHGHFGSGKTTLARILIGKFQNRSPFLELNSSFFTSIDTLRSKVEDFCSKVSITFDDTQDNDKYVFLDEFERTSAQYQDALKSYIEDYSSKGVRFILCTNHINKVSPGIRSRFLEVNFDCQNLEEEKFLKNKIFRKIRDEVLPKEKISLDQKELIKIINNNFPDFRSILIEIDNFKHTGIIQDGNNQPDLLLKSLLFNIILDKNKSFEDIYHFVMENFGPDGVETMINLLGKPFIEWCLKNYKGNSENLFKVAWIITDSYKLVETSLDPIILGVSIIDRIRKSL